MGAKIYTVHTNGWSAAPGEDAILVREGFSLAAFLFGPLWAVWHSMWRTAMVLLFLAVAIIGGAMTAGLTDGAELALLLSLQAATGIWGNDWRRHVLARCGILERGVVAGRHLRDAEWRYLLRGS